MAVEPKRGVRVQHAKHGLGTIDSVQAGDQGPVVFVEHDDGVVRRYVLALCTLTTQLGDTLAKPAPPQTHVEHPPTDQHHRRPKALKPKDAAMPAATTPPADTLFADMVAALRTRGPESKALLADACGLQRHSIKNFISQGRIPTHHRDAVRAWIDAPHARPAAKPKTPPPARPAAAPPVRRITKPIPAPAQRLDVPGLLAALGVNLTFAWINDGGDTMRRVRVAVLPA
jgi:hypothetical protein